MSIQMLNLFNCFKKNKKRLILHSALLKRRNFSEWCLLAVSFSEDVSACTKSKSLCA